MLAHAAMQILHKLPHEVVDLPTREKAVMLASFQIQKEDRDKELADIKRKHKR